MLDCGGGSVREAVRAGITQRGIDAVCLSHLHQDHCCDLAILLADRAFGRLVPPSVYGPKGVEAFVLAGASYVKTMAHAENALPAFCEVADGDRARRLRLLGALGGDAACAGPRGAGAALRG